MTATVPCQCDCLKRYARDPKVPYRYDEDAQSYNLELSSSVSIKNACCIFCAGYGFPHVNKYKYRMRARCHCGALQQWASDAQLPFEYDPELNEYNLLIDHGGGQQGKMSVYFCPSCGGRAPLSHRGDLFTNPSSSEINTIDRRLRKTKCINEIVTILGEPDERIGPCVYDPMQKEVYGLRDTKQQLTYRHLGRTVELFVTEFDDGDIGIGFGGKLKSRRTFMDRLRRWTRRVWDTFR